MQVIGVDVSKEKLHCAWLRDAARRQVRPKSVANTADGHAALLAWATRVTGAAAAELHVVLEATGVYHEAAATFLHDAGCHVSVVNPLQVKRFAESLGVRTKTDRHDGLILALFGDARRPAAWTPPPGEIRQLKALLGRLAALEQDFARELNRLETARAEPAPDAVLVSLQTMLDVLAAEIARLRRQIDDHLDSHPELKEQRALLESIPGIGAKLSLWFLALFRSRTFASARQAAAFLGLVPVEFQSGSSVLKRPRLSKAGDARWRARLFLPAMVAARWNPLVRAQYQRLLAAGKSKMSALGAAMRKLVHIAFGVLKHHKPFDPNVAA
ncbi:MAG: IS110 family transposase [Rhodospirillales bacterium]|nr:IS110 family transposase [Rhodospirillales bacterium]MBK8210412.1 IS110 family transposase [Rhodospirillales bacterium]MBK8211142.1 IS110 family transposase [Rhodospirillales bacterium]